MPKARAGRTLLHQQKTRRNPTSPSTRSLGGQYGVSRTEAGTILKEKNFKFGAPEKIKVLEESEKVQRVKFCRSMLKSNGKRINESIFSDEMGDRSSRLLLKGGLEPSSEKVKIEVP